MDMSTAEVHFDGKVALKAIIARDNEVVVLRDPREPEEIWEIPGGRLNTGESVEEGLIREVREELGVNIEITDVIYMSQFFQHSEQRNALVIVFSARLVDDEKDFILEPSEVQAIRWITKTDLEHMRFFPEYKAALQKYFARLK